MRLGADVAALDSLERAVAEASQRLGHTIRTVDGTVRTLWWQGPDADRFRSAWTSGLAAKAERARTALDQVAAGLKVQADQQRRASSDDPGGPPFGLPGGVAVLPGTRTAVAGGPSASGPTSPGGPTATGRIDTVLGVDAGADHELGIDHGRLELGASGRVLVGAEVAGTGVVTDGPITGTATGRVLTGGVVEGRAGLGAGPDGVHAGAGAEAFVGGRIEGGAGVDAGGVQAAAKGSVSYGLGAEFDADATAGLDKVEVKVDFGATVGLGGEGGVDLEVNPREVAHTVTDTLSDWGGDLADGADSLFKVEW